MGNCVETCMYRQQLGITEGKQEQAETASGGLAKETGLGRSSSLRVKIVLTREELEWLMLQLEENKEKRLEDALAEIERGRRKVLGWRPSLESITESPESLEGPLGPVRGQQAAKPFVSTQLVHG
ncbi:hypothetical protein RJ640_019046 [Escallonia rubra]|uniref:Uncharacterized protein n=1 Tax=Escallonia rubra TaxID=112253 RepID=A0AA88QCI8_9ASTE|nr:hypothetical protein RJ640_019046 [Escallonia rubra]